MSWPQPLKPAKAWKSRTSYVSSEPFERGTQIGGTYKCGCKDHMMQNLPHALAQPWRPLAHLVTAGKYGRDTWRIKTNGLSQGE